MKVKRVITGLVGFPLVVLLLIFANIYVIDVVFSIVALITIMEFSNNFGETAKPVKWIAYLSSIFIAFLHVIPEEIFGTVFGVAISGIIAALFIQVIITNMKTTFNDIAITFFGIIYIVGFLIFIPLLYAYENGKLLVWYIVFAAWGSDTFAYFVGSKFGKHKLTKVSPNKSVEGSIGGLLGTVILFLGYTYALNYYTALNLSYIYIAGLAVILSGLGQFGDLAASSIKRFTGNKEFGNLLPGHGGILDRIDSIIFISPFAFFLLTLLMKI